MSISEWISGKIFSYVHGNNLVYNTCWEDPRLDRIALELKPTDNIMVITSAGCNSLDYVLGGANHVYAVDMNFRQNAVLELKKACIKALDYDDFWKIWGEGTHPKFREIYHDVLRPMLPEESVKFWDKKRRYFLKPKKPYYFRGTSGQFAKMINFYIDKVIKVRPLVDELEHAETIEQQQDIYFNKGLKDKFWTGMMKAFMNRDTTLAMLGVPRAQRYQVESQYEGGIVKFTEDCLEAVMTKLPFKENYFWQVYINGHYSPECCPNYLKKENFEALKNGLVDKVTTHTQSVEQFLREHDDVEISRFILLDHMDWMASFNPAWLDSEWEAILQRAVPGQTRILWRSGGLRTEYVDQINVTRDGKAVKMGELLKYYPEWAAELHEKDRVHTYGSFYIADLLI